MASLKNIAVVGDRDVDPTEELHRAFDKMMEEILPNNRYSILKTSINRGASHVVYDHKSENFTKAISDYPPNWDKYGKQAGAFVYLFFASTCDIGVTIGSIHSKDNRALIQIFREKHVPVYNLDVATLKWSKL